jgi:ABC-type glycerol-3-phosphate transport system permease component
MRSALGARDPLGRAGRLALTLAVTAFFVLPLAWLLASSLRPAAETLGPAASLSGRAFWPHDVTLENFTRMVESGFLRNLANSLIVAGATVVVGLAVCALAAFALAVLDFPGRRVVFGVIVVSFLVPFEAIAIPLADAFRGWGLADSYAGLILPGVGNGLAIFTLRQFFLGIPRELFEAARMDGDNFFTMFWRIALPLAKPALIVAFVFEFKASWNDLLKPLIYLQDPEKYTLPRGLKAVVDEFGQAGEMNWEVVIAALVISTIPMILVFFAGQRYFVEGIATEGRKG